MKLPKTTEAGCYLIRNTISGRVYVGSTAAHRRGLSGRAYNHRLTLRQNIHCNIHLQRAWNKYGEASFEFVVLEILTDPEQIFIREQFWMDHYDAYRTGYNRCPNAGSWKGRRHTAATKRKCSLANQGKTMTAENKAKMSARLKVVNPMHRPEVVAKLRSNYEGEKGRLRGRRISASLKGYVPTAERRKNIAVARMDSEWLRRIRAFMLDYCLSLYNK